MAVSISVSARTYPAIRAAVVLLAGLFLTPQLYADYLSDLESEAKSLDNPTAPPAQDDAASWSVKDLEISNTLQPGLEQPEFEQRLKSSFIGSYTVYTRLDETQKAEVYSAYKDGMSIDELKLLIRDLYNQL